MKFPPMRKHAELMRAHDLITGLMLDREIYEKIVPQGLRGPLMAQADCLCWCLHHDHNRSFAGLLEKLEAKAAAQGLALADELAGAPQPEVVMDEKQFLVEWRVATFLGAYAFWETLKQHGLPDKTRETGEEMVRLLGRGAFRARFGRAHSEKEREAFRYCGLEPVGGGKR